MAETYNSSNYSEGEQEMMKKFRIQLEDAKNYFLSVIKPRLDRSYKLYIADNTDRAKEIQSWQANVSIPYVQAVVETLKPRILDARPEFTVQGRNPQNQERAYKIQYLNDYTWEISNADRVAELATSSSLIFGMGYLQVGWKKDVRTLDFLSSKDISGKKYKWEEKTVTFYDAPYVDWVDNYQLWYDWHNIDAGSKQYWFKRLLLTEPEIRRNYPMADKKRLKMAFDSNQGDLTDYGSVRTQVKLTHEKITKGADFRVSGNSLAIDRFSNHADKDLRMYETFEWTRPFDDAYAVMVGNVPILKNGFIPNPYDFKESPFIDIPYLRIPGEFEGYGIPLILENPQIMLNLIKNQRLDAVTLSIHKQWIVNPLANVNTKELVARPMGIIYTPDPQGVREVVMSDIKSSAYQEEESLKSDMRYGSGVDDFSMGTGGNAGSATEVRHLRESTLERVRLFINHLGEAYSKMMRYWISMYRQFMTEKMVIRITGDDGNPIFPLIEKDDLKGEYDTKATVIPSISGQNDVKKKQDMDLFQLLVNLPFVDLRLLTSKILHDFNWSLNSVEKKEEETPMVPGAEGQPMAQEESGGLMGNAGMPTGTAADALALLGGSTNPTAGQSAMAELSSPVNLLEGNATPPTAKGIPTAKTTNPRGLNRTGKVNTNISLSPNTNPEASLLNQVNNIQS